MDFFDWLDEFERKLNGEDRQGQADRSGEEGETATEKVKEEKEMRKIIAIVAFVFILIGCAGVNVKVNDPVVTAGKVAGFYLLLQHPDMAKVAIPYAQGLLVMAKAGTITSDQVFTAVTALEFSLSNDPKVKVLIRTLLGLITIEIKAGTVNPQVVNGIEGFIEGIGG